MVFVLRDFQSNLNVIDVAIACFVVNAFVLRSLHVNLYVMYVACAYYLAQVGSILNVLLYQWSCSRQTSATAVA